jgi:hypothetical protein
MFVPVTSIATFEGEPPVAFVGRESGNITKYSNAVDLDSSQPRAAGPTISLDGHSGAITGIVAVSADDVYSSSTDGTVRQWNAASEAEGKRETRCLQFPGPIRSLAIAGDVVYAGGQDGVLYVASSSAEGPTIAAWEGHRDSILSISQLEGIVCSASSDNQVRVWDATGRCQYLLIGHTNRVKFVQLLSATSVMTISSDETIRLWTIGEMIAAAEGGTAGGAAAPDGGAEDAQAATASSAAVAEALEDGAAYVPTVRAAAIVAFSEQIQTAVVSGSNTFLGLSNGGLCSVNTRDFQRTLADFQARNRAVVSDERKRVEKDRVERSNKLRLKQRKNVQNKKKELRKIERDEAAAAFAEKLRLFKEQQAENGEDEASGEEPPQEEEVPEDAPLTQEHEDALAAFIAEEERATLESIDRLKAAAAARIESVAPIAGLVYTSPAESFFKLPFTRHYPSGVKEGVVALSVQGRSAYAGCGGSVRVLSVVPGVTAL